MARPWYFDVLQIGITQEKVTSSGSKNDICGQISDFICDVLGKSEVYFWNSTPAELLSRWKEYAIAMGYAEEPEKILEFDTEGM